MALNLTRPITQPDPMMVRIWPDNTWVLFEDYRDSDWSHMSDDYQDVDLNDFAAFQKLPQHLQSELLTDIFAF